MKHLIGQIPANSSLQAVPMAAAIKTLSPLLVSLKEGSHCFLL